MYLLANTSFAGHIATGFGSDVYPFGVDYPLDKLDTLQADVDINIKQASYSGNSFYAENYSRYAIVMAVERTNGPNTTEGGYSTNVYYTELDFWDSSNAALGGKPYYDASSFTPTNKDDSGSMQGGGDCDMYKIYDWENKPLNQWQHFHFDFLPYINTTLKFLSGTGTTAYDKLQTGTGIQPSDKLIMVYVLAETINLNTTSELLVTNFSVTSNSYCYMLNKTIQNASGASCTSANWNPAADVNKDGKVDVSDLLMWAQNSDNESWCRGRLNDNTPGNASLTVTASPPSPQYFGTPVTFTITYSDARRNPIPNAAIQLNGLFSSRTLFNVITCNPSFTYGSGVYTFTTNSTCHLSPYIDASSNYISTKDYISVNAHSSNPNYQDSSYNSVYMVYPLPTTLTQSVTPASGTVTAPLPTFMCRYTSSGSPVTGANVWVYINSWYVATYSPATGNYSLTMPLLNGTHTWNCTVEKDGYTPQQGAQQSYYVQQAPTTLTQQTLNPSPQVVDITAGMNPPHAQAIFSADYNFSNMAIPSSDVPNLFEPNATVTFYLDGIPYATIFTGGYPLLHYVAPVMPGMLNLTVGVHTWYFTATAPGFQPQTGPTQTFIVNPYPTTLTQKAGPPSPQPINPTTNNVLVFFTADYNLTFQGGSFAVWPNATVALYVDGVAYTTESFPGVAVNLSLGTHTWYFTATAPGFQPQTGPTQTYVVTLTPSPVAALKGGSDGYLYIPNASKIDPSVSTTIGYLKVELWCNMSDTACQVVGNRTLCGCNRTWCDQTGGTNPYYTKTNAPAFWRGADWPNGRVRVDDTLFIAQAFGSNEGDIALPRGANWSYMADCVLTGGEGRKVRVTDVLQTSSTFGADGTYSSDTTNIRVKFNNNPNFFTPDANGYIQIPSGAVNFTVYNGTKPVMALATFYNTSAGVAAAQAKQAGIATPAVQMPIGDTWTMAVVILAIIGLAIGYFIMKEALFVSTPRRRKRR
jgi:hypothetical protein